LFIDTALAVQVPYDSPTQDIASHTISTAQDSGWIWDIGLPTRRGVGHVYSSRHGNEEQARENLLAYISQTSDCDLTNLTIRKINFEPGIRETFWQNNCVAVGMAAGFLEPLEASALVMIELAAAAISEHLPTTREAMTIVAKQYNEKFHYNWQRIIDFLKLHYVASKRDDSAFWRDNQLAETIPQSLQELLVLWQHRPPSEFDFPQKREVFSAASYQYVLHGMHYPISLPLTAQLKREQSAQHAAHLIASNQKLSQQFLQQLPTNRELLNALQQFAFPSL
jgi:hypothetical protein